MMINIPKELLKLVKIVSKEMMPQLTRIKQMTKTNPIKKYIPPRETAATVTTFLLCVDIMAVDTDQFTWKYKYVSWYID